MEERNSAQATLPKWAARKSHLVQITTQVVFTFNIYTEKHYFVCSSFLIFFLYIIIFIQANRTFASFFDDKNYFGDNFVTLPSQNVVSV